MGFIRIIFDKTQHRTKNNLNFVFSGVQKFLCLEFPGTVHIICFCKECAVDADFRKCVKSFTHQNNMLLGQEFFIDIKRPGENIILPEQCACSILIGTVKWIFYFSGGKKPLKYRFACYISPLGNLFIIFLILSQNSSYNIYLSCKLLCILLILQNP